LRATLSFAIVIPNLNQSRFLSTALESLRHQSVAFQLAVMDGGSKDGFEAAIAPYRDMITHWRSRPDQGQSAAIQEGLERVRGDIVCWLNADDYYFPHALDRIRRFFLEHPDADVVYGDAIHVNADGIFLCYFPPVQPFRRKDLTRSCFICQPACFVRRAAYHKAGGIDPHLHFTMDWDLWNRLAQEGARFQYLQEPLAAVRYYQGTKTLSGGWRRYLEIARIERRYGKRPFPFTWLGFYRYDLFSRGCRTRLEGLCLEGLDTLRKWRRRLSRRSGSRGEQGLLYGFERWEPVVEGRCVIHQPWYHGWSWKRIKLRLEPSHEKYRIFLNGHECEARLTAEGILEMDVPANGGVLKTLVVEHEAGKRWRFSGLSPGHNKAEASGPAVRRPFRGKEEGP